MNDYQLKVLIPDPLYNYPQVCYIEDEIRGILIELFENIITNLNGQNLTYLYGSNFNSYDIQLMQTRNIDMEKAITIITEERPIDYSYFEVFFIEKLFFNYKNKKSTNYMLQENYIFVYPSLIVALFQKIIIELFINYSLTIIPWILFNANITICFLRKDDRLKNKNYSQLLIYSLKVLLGNEKTNQCTLFYKLMFVIATIFISTIIFIDFIYVIGNLIQRQSYSTLNDLSMNQYRICIINDDPFVINMVQRFRSLNYISAPTITSCLNQISNSEDFVMFISEFKLGTYLKDHNFGNYYKYQIKSNSYKSYFMLINNTLPIGLKQQINQTIWSIQSNKIDLDIRNKYLIQLLYNQKTTNSLLISNKTYLLCSCCFSILLLSLIQISIIQRHYNIFKESRPFKFQQKVKQIQIQQDPEPQSLTLNGLFDQL